MRRLVVAVLLVVLLAPASATAWPPDRDRVQRYLADRAGSVSYAVIGPKGVTYSYRAARSVLAASVIKMMLMVAYLRRPSVRDRDLRASDRELLGPMIRRSKDIAAERVADLLGPGPVKRLARAAGMERIHYDWDHWGSSTVTAGEQARFMYRLERFIPDRHEPYARYLLAHVIARHRWGIGRLRHDRWQLFFKGGWGSGSGAVCHQVAFMERGGLRIAAAVMITNSPSHAYATETLEGVFRRLLRHLPKPGG